MTALCKPLFKSRVQLHIFGGRLSCILSYSTNRDPLTSTAAEESCVKNSPLVHHPNDTLESPEGTKKFEKIVNHEEGDEGSTNEESLSTSPFMAYMERASIGRNELRLNESQYHIGGSAGENFIYKYSASSKRYNISDYIQKLEGDALGAIRQIQTPSLSSLLGPKNPEVSLHKIVEIVFSKYVGYLKSNPGTSFEDRSYIFLKGCNLLNFLVNTAQYNDVSTLFNVMPLHEYLQVSLQKETKIKSFQKLYSRLSFERVLPIHLLSIVPGGVAKQFLSLAARSHHNALAYGFYEHYKKIDVNFFRDPECLDYVLYCLRDQPHAVMTLVEQYMKEGGEVTESIVLRMLSSFVFYGEVFYAELIYDRYVRLPLVEKNLAAKATAMNAETDAANAVELNSFALVALNFSQNYLKRATVHLLEVYDRKNQHAPNTKVLDRVKGLYAWMLMFVPELIQDSDIKRLFISFDIIK